MSKEDNGGPAFPEMRTVGEQGDYWTEHTPGMTLRDWFAGQALIGLLAHPDCMEIDEGVAEIVAAEAYESADAMIKERSK